MIPVSDRCMHVTYKGDFYRPGMSSFFLLTTALVGKVMRLIILCPSACLFVRLFPLCWTSRLLTLFLSLLPSTGPEISTGQGAVAVLCGREGNRRSGVALAMTLWHIHLRARWPKKGKCACIPPTVHSSLSWPRTVSKTRKTLVDRGSRSDRPRYRVTMPYWTFTLTFNPRQGSYPHTQKLKFKRQSVQNIEWKQTDGRTDGQTCATDCFTFPPKAVDNEALSTKSQYKVPRIRNSAVALHCCKAHSKINRKMEKSIPL